MQPTGGRPGAACDLAGVWWFRTKLFKQTEMLWSRGRLIFSAGLSALFELISRGSMV